MSFRSLFRRLFGWREFGITRSDLVLEVGSGNRPCPRSDILCDFGDYGNEEQCGGGLLTGTVMDRPFVFGDAQRLPFRDRSFDYLICSHTMEHLDQPELFLNEATRVSARGCIITPSAVFERVFAEPTHRWYVSLMDGRLLIQAKEPDDRGVAGDLFRRLFAESSHLRKFVMSRLEDVFETRCYYTDGKIDFEVQGNAPPPRSQIEEDPEFRSYLRRLVSSNVFAALGRSVRFFACSRKVRFDDLLSCPACRGHAQMEGTSCVRCQECSRQYPLRDGRYPVMLDSMAS